MSLPTTPEEIADHSIKHRQMRAERYLAGITNAGLALNIDMADLHYLWDTAGRMYVDLTSGGGAMPMGNSHLVNDSIWANPKATYPHVGAYGQSCLEVQVAYAAAISERFPEVDGEPQKVWLAATGNEAMNLAQGLAGANHHTWANIKPLAPLDYAPLDTGEAQKVGRAAMERSGLIVLDERISGYGRLGDFRAGQRYGLDEFAPVTISVLGESGGGGIPFGAVVAPSKIFAGLDVDISAVAPSFGGNPIACSAGLRILELQDGMFYEHVRDMSAVLTDSLVGLRSQFPEIITGHTGRGMAASFRIDPKVDMSDLKACLINNGVLTNVYTDHVSILPPLIMTEAALHSAFDQIAAALVDLSR